MDEWIPTPKREVDKPVLLAVEDVFTITGRGTVATGRIERGTLKVNDEIDIIGINKGLKKSCCYWYWNVQKIIRWSTSWW